MIARASIALSMIALAGCDRGTEGASDTLVQSYGGDPENYTSSGFPRHVYPVIGCNTDIKLKPPFAVSEGGWGDADIRVPLTLLDDPGVKDITTGGPDAQSRVSFAFPSKHRGVGMKEWFASGVKAATAPIPRPVESVVATLASTESIRGDGTGGDTRYLGNLPDGREVALYCSATDWANPTCRAEVAIGPGDQRYLAVFPPQAAAKFTRILEIGDGLFAGPAARCKPD